MKNRWQQKLKADPIPWLIQSNPWTKYRTLTDLLDKPLSSGEVEAAREALCDSVQVTTLVKETSDWMPKLSTRNNDPKISYFKKFLVGCSMA